jgi:hypothetical protein
VLAGQVADARVDAGPLAAGQAGGVGFGGDLGGGPVTVAGQDREGPGRGPVLGGGVPGIVEAPSGTPDVFQLSTVSAREGCVLAGHIVVAIDVTLTRR